ncbi:uncharacterized protein [Eurosta solidaginis]|uniref:uncharacterized protein n=1 Tax=Eurosta solidaginis TaxID=178769 RepID=UPI003530E2D7
MRSCHHIIKTICLLLLIQLISARTVVHRRTLIDANGNKRTETWTTQEPDIDPTTDAGFQTFTRNGVTLRIKPESTALRFGGNNISADQLLVQARYAKEIDLLAVRQLLSTGHPVTRTNIENGRKLTSTYTLEPDGSIVCRKVEEIDMADVDRRFEEIFKQRSPRDC